MPRAERYRFENRFLINSAKTTSPARIRRKSNEAGAQLEDRRRVVQNSVAVVGTRKGIANSIPAGERVLVLYGAANRDERHFPDPDRFDVTRDARDHLAFGQGAHRCAGAHLAQLELEALLRALIARVRRIEVGEPEVLMSKMLRGLQSLPASFRC